MDHITQNSSPLDALRPAKFPYPDADFFMAFVPEAVFALVVGTLAALAYWHFSRLISGLSKDSHETELRAPTSKERALLDISALDAEDPDFAAKAWLIIRKMLADSSCNARFASMTAEEAVKATKGLPGFDSLAYFARELEYADRDRDAQSHEKLRDAAVKFIEGT